MSVACAGEWNPPLRPHSSLPRWRGVARDRDRFGEGLFFGDQFVAAGLARRESNRRMIFDRQSAHLLSGETEDRNLDLGFSVVGNEDRVLDEYPAFDRGIRLRNDFNKSRLLAFDGHNFDDPKVGSAKVRERQDAVVCEERLKAVVRVYQNRLERFVR